jgi:hypothetical protein
MQLGETMKPFQARTRWLIAVAAFATAGLGAQALYHHYASKFQVRVTSIGEPGNATPYGANRSSARDESQERWSELQKRVRDRVSTTSMSPEQADAFYAPDDAVRTIKVSALLHRLEGDVRVSPAEKQELGHVFQLAASMQRAIDTISDESEQEIRQRQLLEQVDVRLRKILVDRERIDVARQVLSGLPRIEADS